MPIFEFRCKKCGKTTTMLWRSGSNVNELNCRHCNHSELEKLVSPFSVHKSLGSQLSSLDPMYDKMVDQAIKNTPQADPEIHLKKMKPFPKDR
ncbi:MAG: zinc ribbon domain-containing protein [Pseudomonadales bacterium]|nr:zinc ribbon domain-containing protein [Pseudomonadales bacterium]MDP7594137.1 zinc ribbon domain-containing protein [Pseudomonadales bacterium]HJN49442.1 zinc ribbon domain-containing protein [Pseudomonadales bacterium]